MFLLADPSAGDFFFFFVKISTNKLQNPWIQTEVTRPFSYFCLVLYNCSVRKSGHTFSINRKTIRGIVLLNEIARIPVVPY